MWRGLDSLHQLTSTHAYSLMVDMTDWMIECMLSVGYMLNSTTSDSLTASSSKFVHNGMNFTTIDRDNDKTATLL